MDSRTKNATRNLAWGLVNKLLAILLPFATRTVLIYSLGVEYIGLNALFVSVLNVLNLAELGVGSALVFSMYRPVVDQDKPKIEALLSFYRKCYHVIGAVVLLLGLALVPILPFLIEGDCPEDVNLYLLYLIYLGNAVLGYFLFAFKQSVFIATQRNDIISNINSVLSVVSAALQVVLLLCFHSYYLYVLVLPVITCLNNIVIAVMFRRRFPGLVCRGKLDKNSLASIKTNVLGLMTQKIGTVVLSSTGSVVISAFLGLVVLGRFNNYYYILTALFGFLTIIQTSIIPSIGNSIITTDTEKNHRDFCRFLFIYVWVLSWFAVCFLTLASPFVSLWLGGDNVLPFDVVALMALYLYAYKMNDMTYVYREAAGIWRQGMLIPLIAAVVNVCLSIILVQIWGLQGVLAAGIASLLFVYTPWYTRVLFRHYFKDLQKWRSYLLAQLRYFCTAFFVALASYVAISFVPGSTLIGFIVKTGVAIVLPNALFTIAYFRREEFSFFKQIILGSIKSFWHTK